MITVIGKLEDTKQYVGRDGFNVLANREDWTVELNQQFIDEAIKRGDHLLFVSWQASGQYRIELLQIILCLTNNSMSRLSGDSAPDPDMTWAGDIGMW